MQSHLFRRIVRFAYISSPPDQGHPFPSPADARLVFFRNQRSIRRNSLPKGIPSSGPKRHARKNFPEKPWWTLPAAIFAGSPNPQGIARRTNRPRTQRRLIDPHASRPDSVDEAERATPRPEELRRIDVPTHAIPRLLRPGTVCGQTQELAPMVFGPMRL